MATNFDPVAKIEHLPEELFRIYVDSLDPLQAAILQVGDVDLAAGTGVIDPRTRCYWTQDGRRITFAFASDFRSILCRVSDEADPARPRS